MGWFIVCGWFLVMFINWIFICMVGNFDCWVILLSFVYMIGEMIICYYLIKLGGRLVVISWLVFIVIKIYLCVIIISNDYVLVIFWGNLKVVMIIMWCIWSFECMFFISRFVVGYIYYIYDIFILSVCMYFIVVLGFLV